MSTETNEKLRRKENRYVVVVLVRHAKYSSNDAHTNNNVSTALWLYLQNYLYAFSDLSVHVLMAKRSDRYDDTPSIY